MSAGDIHSILYRGEDPLTAKPKPKHPEQPKIQRYWPGKVPDYAQEPEENETPTQPEEIVKIENLIENRRILRLTETQKEIVEKPDGRTRRDRIVVDFEQTQPELPVSSKLAKVTEEPYPHETPDERRERTRQKALEIRQKEENEMDVHTHSEYDFEEESTEENTESEEDGPSAMPLMKPIYVPKEKRDTIKEKDELEAEEKYQHQLIQEKLEAKKVESQKLVAELVKQEEQNSLNIASDMLEHSDTELPDDNDEVNEADEYEAWKLRELKRLNRDKEEREARSAQHAELERRRGLTEEERFIENKQIDATIPKAEKKYKPAFMQKYYHKGAFFQDKAQEGNEDIYLRDYQAPVGEDNMNKKILPKAMRLRRGQFGRAGQVKHTHLVDVDTTDFNAPWAKVDASQAKLRQKMAGLKGEKSFDRPKLKKK